MCVLHSTKQALISKSTENLMKRWRARGELLDRGITHHNTPDYFNLVTQEVKKIEFKNGTKEEIIAELDDSDTVKIEWTFFSHNEFWVFK